MLEAFLAIPYAIRLVLLFGLGAAVGGQINRAIYRLAWTPRDIGPWSAPPPKAPPRRWFDRIPIFGWWTLRRESPPQNAGFWIRPLLIELACGIGLAALYAWETQGALLAPHAGLDPNLQFSKVSIIHAQFTAHAVLIGLMIVATFIDFDEQTIPDAITVPGVLIALAFAVIAPQSTMLTVTRDFTTGRGVWLMEPLLLVTPQKEWSTWLNGPRGLAIGVGCFLAWCAALLPFFWTTRRGWKKAVLYCLEKLRRLKETWIIAGIALIGAVCITAVWAMAPAEPGGRWEALLTSLVGMAFGGGLVWIIRIIAGVVMQKEAMGFGDVTLMAMIGAFLGWQPSLMIFFMAPFAALFIALAQVILTRRPEIAFGPYLSLAALLLIVFWDDIWRQRAADVFSTLGWMIPQILGVCLVLFAGMLAAWMKIKELLLGKVRLN